MLIFKSATKNKHTASSALTFTYSGVFNNQAGCNNQAGRRNVLKIVNEHALLLDFYYITPLKLHIEQAIINEQEEGIS